MPVFKYVTCDVFTDKRFGGNQLAVFPDARKIPPRLYQDIARDFNFTETTFVLPPKNKQPLTMPLRMARSSWPQPVTTAPPPTPWTIPAPM